MIIAVVGAAPWLYLPDRPPCNALIAINRAALHIDADMWCFGDMETWRDVKPLGNPQWFTNANAHRRIIKRGGMPPVDTLLWEQVEGPPGVNWTVFSATAALVLAKSLGATTIHCYGVVDEFPQSGESTRWATERRIWNETVAWLGLPVVRK